MSVREQSGLLHFFKNIIQSLSLLVWNGNALRGQAYKAGISQDILVKGDANQLNYSNDEFDLVCEFGVLHHVPKHDLVVK